MRIKRFQSYRVVSLLEAMTALEQEPSDEKKAELFKFAYEELDNETKIFLKRFCLSIQDKKKLGDLLVDILQNAKTKRIG